MTKLCKKVLLVCLMVLSVVCMGLVAACNNGSGGGGSTVTYTVTVVDENDAPVKGVKVRLKKGSSLYDAVESGDDGKAEFTLTGDTYDVAFIANTIPEGYEAPTGVQVTKDSPSVKATLVKKLRYVVNLVDEDGEPFYHQNVYIALCVVGGSCLTPSLLNTDGTWSMSNIPDAEYKVQINLPADIKDSYTFEGNTADSHYYESKHLTANDSEVTIVIHPLNSLDLTKEMSIVDKSAFSNGFSQFASSNMPASFFFEFTFKANETKYLAFEPYKSGDYVLFCKKANTEFKFDEETYSSEGNLAQGLRLTQGKIVYFTATPTTAGKVQLVISGPDATSTSSDETMTGAGTKSVTVDSTEKYATIRFTPSQTGIYEITSEGNYDTKVLYYANGISMFLTDDDDDSGEGKNFKYGGIEFKEVGATAAFHIYVKEGATFPATFNVKITRTGDAEEIIKRTSQKVNPAELGDSAYDAAGLFTEVDLKTAQTVLKGQDSYYHLGTADGPVLVAKLSKAFRNCAVFTSEQTMKAVIPYTMAFADYASETIYWDYTDFIKAYAEKCNADGVYPVNEEVKTMLERWAGIYVKANNTSLMNALGQVADGNGWLVPCGYYVVNELTGTGADNDAYRLGYGKYDIPLAAATTHFTMLAGEYSVTVKTTADITISDGVNATKTADGYKFECKSTLSNQISFTITHGESGAVEVKISSFGQAKDAGNVLVVGSNEVTGDYYEGVIYTFTPEESGEYTISSASADSALFTGEDTVYTDADGDMQEGGFTVTFNAVAGETYSILLGAMDESGSTYTVVVSKKSAQG